MKPDEKGTLIKQLQVGLARKPLVGFCGDGANDCNALKGADVGISLSPAEASIAAPFTSRIQDISCVPILLLEGRAALTTSFNCFKFMVMYSVCESVSVCILYFSYTNLSGGQFLFVDLFIILPVSVAMGFTETTEKLSKSVPKGSLICLPVISSVVGLAII
jgi:cation-transporting P-type ATPase 13A2